MDPLNVLLIFIPCNGNYTIYTLSVKIVTIMPISLLQFMLYDETKDLGIGSQGCIRYENPKNYYY